MDILIGILCVPVGLLVLCLVVLCFAAFEWLFDHGLLHMLFCGSLASIFGAVASGIVGASDGTIFCVSFIVGAVIGLILYVHHELTWIKEHAKDDKNNNSKEV